MSEKTKINHLAIIMDGNRRWAKARGLPAFEGHRAGYQKVREVLGWCQEVEIKTLTLYAFSTENWQRSVDEVSGLMGLFELLFSKDIHELHKNNIRVRVLGSRKELSVNLQKLIVESEELTKNNTSCFLNLAINYGGRQEIVNAFNSLVASGEKEITEDILEKHLYTYDQPDPDAIVRTSGENRLSGFLLWQGAYSELFFVQHNWPEFSRDDFDKVLGDFNQRQRRFGV
jgi:undecaprenyl diphosphate synthase